ncbi:unnamed protein product [Orchesella dallaii]|uniref:PHD-type domain-containing protein n=1 Tax=Orchesella dallaii TaxID=48710 RepID=A0ABP1PLA9_9HEXA
MTPKNQFGTRSSRANVRRIGHHRSRSVSSTSSTASTVVPDLAEEEVNEGVVFVAPGTRKIKRRQSLSPDITSFREIKSNPGLLRNKPSTTHLRKGDTKSQQSKLSQPSGPTDRNKNGTRSSEAEANVSRIGQHRSRSVSATSSIASPVAQDVEEREVNEGVTLVAPGTRKIKRRQSLSPDITSFRGIKSNPVLLRNKPSTTHFRKVDTKSQQSKLSQPSGPTDRNKNGTRSSEAEANVRRIGQHRSRSVSPTFSSASTVVSDPEENEVNELVTLVASSPPLLRIKQCSVLLRRVNGPCEESSETVQAVEKIAFLRAGQAEVASVSPKEKLHTDKKKTELYNDNESVRDVATDDPITPRNEEEETKKADAIAGYSLNLGPNIISSPLLPSSDSFCSLGVALPSMEATRQWVVRQNRKNRESSSSTQAAAETALASSSSSVALITKAVENVTLSAKKSTSKVFGTPRKRLPVPTLKIVDGKSVFMRDGKNINVDADPKLRKEVLKCDSDVPWICSFCHLGPHVQVRVLNNHGHVSPYAMGDLFGPYFANLPSIYGKPSPKRETWMHGDCGVWAGRLLLVKTSLKYLEETLSSADKEVCIVCGKNGATIGCFRRKCKLAVHFPCAKSKGWKLDGVTFLGYCPEHR